MASLLLTLGSPLGVELSRHRPGQLPQSVGRRHVLGLGLGTALFGASASSSFADDEAPMTPAECKKSCFKECNTVAPGNKEYCVSQCDSFCDTSSVTAPADTSADLPDISKDLGIFGDSGVGYSNGVEDLFATAFGAKRQSKDIKSADVGEFASEVGEAFRSVVSGGEK